MTNGWAPSASIVLHVGVLVAAILVFDKSTPVTGDKSIAVSLVTLPPPPPPRTREPVIAPRPEPPPVSSTVEIAPVSPPIQKSIKKPMPKPRLEPAPMQPESASTTEQNMPPTVAAEPRDPPVRSAEPAGPSPSYLAVLRQKLERNKIYPGAARQRRQEGTAILRFVVDRDGHVVSRRVEKSSGYADLDREVEAMLERAQPLPSMPAEMTQTQLELVVPVDFHLR